MSISAIGKGLAIAAVAAAGLAVSTPSEARVFVGFGFPILAPVVVAPPVYAAPIVVGGPAFYGYGYGYGHRYYGGHFFYGHPYGRRWR